MKRLSSLKQYMSRNMKDVNERALCIRYLGEESSRRRNSKCKGSEGAFWTCLQRSKNKKVSIPGNESKGQGRTIGYVLAGNQVRLVASEKSMQLIVGDGKSFTLTLIVMGKCRSNLNIETTVSYLYFKRFFLATLLQNSLEMGRVNSLKKSYEAIINNSS